ncbi:MAG TPA: PEP/pyruvate-binding domain-containing protein, partial [Flavobacteriales bacterium]|nr:PEP/pyruvate-binding domain-containing protein [Flavobacteriales bacterium]
MTLVLRKAVIHVQPLWTPFVQGFVFNLTPYTPMASAPYLKWLHEVELKDIPTVGGKNASLGEMIQNLAKLGVKVPGGFVVTVASYEAFIEHNELDQKIKDIVAGLDVDDVENIRRTGLAVRTLIKNGKFPEEIWKGILA